MVSILPKIYSNLKHKHVTEKIAVLYYKIHYIISSIIQPIMKLRLKWITYMKLFDMSISTLNNFLIRLFYFFATLM